MAKAGSGQFALLTIDGVNLLGAKPTEMRWKTEALQEETTGLGDRWPDHTPTALRRATVTQAGAYFDTAQNGMHETLAGMPLAGRVLTWSPDGVTLFRAAGTLVTTYEVLAQHGGLTKANVTYQISGALQEDGSLVQPVEDHPTTWTGPTIDLGAASAAGGTAVQGVSGIVGAVTGFVGRIRHSPDGVAWTDLATFANVTAAPNAQTVTIAGAIQQYVDFAGTITGTGSVRVSAGLFRT